MVLLLPESAAAVIRAAAAAAYPNEGCGLLVGHPATETTPHQRVHLAIALENHWQPDDGSYTEAPLPPTTDAPADGTQAPLSQRRRYRIDPADWLRVQRQARAQQLDIIGIFHSHPDHPADPSECDRRLAWPQYSYIIAAVMGGKVEVLKSWQLNDSGQFDAEAIVMATG